MKFHIITIFPEIFNSYFNKSIIKRAQKNNIIDIKVYDLRQWTTDKHKTVDDAPYGGGAGMVMKVEPIYKALRSVRAGSLTREFAECSSVRKMAEPKKKVILFSAKGKTWNQQMAKKYANLYEVIMICGRYEGVDERVKKLVDEEISIGDYVLTGGEIPAMIMVDSITRLLPGALGNSISAEFESHAEPGILEYPQYTRPEVFEIKGRKSRVPKVLLSGNHKEIEEWRVSHQKKK